MLKFFHNCAPKSVVLLSEFFVEPIVDERVAEVVDEEKVAKLRVQLQDEDHKDGEVGDDETKHDCKKHLDRHNMLRFLLGGERTCGCYSFTSKQSKNTTSAGQCKAICFTSLKWVGSL